LFTVAGLVAVAAILLMGGGPVSEMLPVLTVFGAAVVKLMPAAKGLYSASTGMRANTVYLKEYYEDLKEAMERPSPAEEEGDAASFAESLRFEGVSFTYPGSSSPVLEQVDFILRRGDFVGLSGPSGGGKSTLIDLLLGLLEPTEGRILLDGVPIAGHTGSWQRLVGYVPQHIRLLDDTLEHNVALGLPDEEIDRDRVWQVLEDAQLSDFVKSLPDGLGSRVGETGIRLSGGQRQRIGIARALYNDPQVLVFDEATSALDAKTEEALTRTIADLGKGRTILLAAHRERTLARCTSRYRVTGRGVCREETAAQKQ
jgi:ABC-type multidrug transport system fused ATPase/permease subunit